MPFILENLEGNLPRIPLTSTEIKTALQVQLEKDEKMVIDKLATLGSETGKIFTRLKIRRGVVKETISNLRGNRKAQENLVSILAATRFKFYHKGELYPVECPRGCGQVDSYLHMLECYALTEYEKVGADATEYLTKMALSTMPGRRGPPVPIFNRGAQQGAEGVGALE